jgi:O-antigen/teichoic acid export membrane protein
MFKKTVDLAKSSKGFQQSFITIVGNTIATTISAIAFIFISRALGPSLFGEFSFGFSIIMIISRINDLGINSALMKYVGQTTNINKINTYFSISLRIKLIISAILFIIGIFFYPFLNNIFNLNHPKIILFSFTLGLSTVYLEHLNAMLQSLHRFYQAVLTNIFQAITKIIGIFILLYFEIKNVTVLFSFYILAPLAPIFAYKKLLPHNIQILIKLVNSKEKSELYNMAKHTGLANISTVLVSQVSVIFVQAYLTSYETGILGGISKIQMLFSLLASSLSNVLFPRVSRYKEKHDIMSYLKKSFIILVLTYIGLLISFLLAKPMIIFSIGSEYLTGLNVLYILLAAVFTMIATVPFTALFYSYNRNTYFSISGFLQVILILAGNFILIPKMGLIGTAYTQLITRVVLLIFTMVWGIKLSKE